MRNSLLFLLSLTLCSFVVNAATPSVKFLQSPSAESTNLPFSEAVLVDSTLYLSGQIGVKPGSKSLVKGGMATEAKQTMENIKMTLERHGFSLSDIVKCTVMLQDINEWADFNQVYVTYFEKPFPARSAFAASGLALGAKLEVECIAVTGAKDTKSK